MVRSTTLTVLENTRDASLPRTLEREARASRLKLLSR